MIKCRHVLVIVLGYPVYRLKSGQLRPIGGGCRNTLVQAWPPWLGTKLVPSNGNDMLPSRPICARLQSVCDLDNQPSIGLLPSSTFIVPLMYPCRFLTPFSLFAPVPRTYTTTLLFYPFPQLSGYLLKFSKYFLLLRYEFPPPPRFSPGFWLNACFLNTESENLSK